MKSYCVLSLAALAAGLGLAGQVGATEPFKTPKAAQQQIQPQSQSSAQSIPAKQAYREVLYWATGNSDQGYLDALYDRIERGSYRYEIVTEFALAIIAAEASYGRQVKGAPMSWARNDSWSLYESSVGTKLQRYPLVMDDLDTSMSSLRLIMNQSKTVEDVYRLYWCGPDSAFNTESLSLFSEAVSKLYNGLEPYARARLKTEDDGRYSRDYSGELDNLPAWAGVADGNMDGYASQIGSMPRLASQLKSFPGHEETYARMAQKYNKKLSDSEAIVIARAILTFCEATSYGDKEKYWVDPRFVMALIRAESAFKPRAVSSAGAMGLGQLMPATARGHGIRDAFDPIQNIWVCVRYVEREQYRWRSSPNRTDLVLAAYNAGPGAVKKYKGVPPYKETRNYVKIVKKYYAEFAPGRKG